MKKGPSIIRILTQNSYFSLLTHAKQLLLVIFFNTIAGNGASFQTHAHRQRNRWKDYLEVESFLDSMAMAVYIC